MTDCEQELPTPFELGSVDVTECGELFVSGRYHIGGHFGSKPANDVRELDQEELLRLHSRLSEAIEERGLDD